MSNSGPLILMLEDESDRLERFFAILAQHASGTELRHWRTAQDFIAGYRDCDQIPELLCLDHDLFVDSPGDPDPGDGRDVAEFLAQNEPCCHVIIHSSNTHAAESMYFTLLEAKWDVERIAPLGQDWIESYWWPVARPWLRSKED